MINAPKTIKTDRLILKSVTIDDVDNFYDAFSESFKNLNQYYSPAWAKLETLPNKQEMKGYVARTVSEFKNDESYVYSAYDHKNNFIGQAELHHVDLSVPKARLGYWVRSQQESQGYATEMANILTHIGFDKLGCKRLEIRSDTRNKASSKIAKNLDYRFLTVFEKNKQGKKGDFWNLEIYDRLNSDSLPPLNIEYLDASPNHES